MSQPTPMPSRLGRYRLLQLLGAGGMGTVYLAEDVQLSRKVAVKVPHLTADAGPDVLARFLREARVAAAIEHPYLCPIHDVGEDNGVHYLVMPFIEGTPLSRLVSTDRPWPLAQAVALVRKLAGAVQALHARGMIHRDLKPSNVMIRASGEPVVMDFGLARSLTNQSQPLTRLGAVLGTPGYMAPEQVLGDAKTLGPATDIYSLSIILYELLTGKPPFWGPPAAVYGQILHALPEAPSKLRQGLEPTDAVCLKALEKKPEARYASMTDFARALGLVVPQLIPSSATPATTPRPPPLLVNQAPGPTANPKSAVRSEELAPVSVGCPRCGKKLKVPGGTQNRRLVCGQCRAELPTPAAAARETQTASRPPVGVGGRGPNRLGRRLLTGTAVLVAVGLICGAFLISPKAGDGTDGRRETKPDDLGKVVQQKPDPAVQPGRNPVKGPAKEPEKTPNSPQQPGPRKDPVNVTAEKKPSPPKTAEKKPSPPKTAEEKPSQPKPADPNRYREIDDHALRIPPTGVEQSLERLAAYLTGPARSDEEKVRAIFRWVTDRITFDLETVQRGTLDDLRRKNTADAVLTNRKAVCQGYACLVDDLCKQAGIESVLIDGRARGLLNVPGMRDRAIRDRALSHAWNAVKLSGKWQLLDATRGAGLVEKERFVKRFNDFFFLTPPDRLILIQLPSKPQWQLLSSIVSGEQFDRWSHVDRILLSLGVTGTAVQKAMEEPRFRGFVKVPRHEGIRMVLRKAPLGYYLKAGKRFSIKLESRDLLKVAVATKGTGEASWRPHFLTPDGNCWQGTVETKPGILRVTAKMPGKGSQYWTVLEYLVEKDTP